MPVATTPSGRPVTCDGCGAPVESVTAAMKHPVPPEIALAVYGNDNAAGDLVYIVCAPLPGGTQPCLDLALLADELYERVRCRVPGCDGTRCRQEGRPVTKHPTRLDVRHLTNHALRAIAQRVRYAAEALRSVERDGDAVIIRVNSGGNALAVEHWLNARGYRAEYAGSNPDGYGAAVRVTAREDQT